MRPVEEFKVRNAAGVEVTLQKIVHDGYSYLDFGLSHLPHDFDGYKGKYTGDIAEPAEGGFKFQGANDLYRRV